MAKKFHRRDSSSGSDLKTELIRLFTNHTGELFKTNELSKMIGIRSDDDRYQELRDLIRDLERAGVVTRGSRRRYGIPLALPSTASGLLKIERNGHGIVKPDPQSGMRVKIFINKNELYDARSGDRVLVRLHIDKSQERPTGSIADIIESKHPLVAGKKKEREESNKEHERLRKQKEKSRTAHDIHTIRDEPQREVRRNYAVKEQVEPKYSEEIEELIGEFGLPTEFPPEVLSEVEAYGEKIPKEEVKNRLDLRKETIFTIDPEDAKDFDDAISLKENDDWTVTLGVHIADVSYFVRENTELDREALERGTSIYLAGGVIPMLPEQLSNELCSLKPGVERLTFSVMMTVDPLTGKVKHSEFKRSVIKSAMRFSYEEAEHRITTGKGKYAKLLRSMKELSLQMYSQRRKEGSIDFETDEVRFKFDESGTPIEAVKKERLGSMRMIEEFMLAANRAVAEFISKKAIEGNEKPFLYRIHADPDADKLRDIAKLAKSLGYNFDPEQATPKAIQKFLDSIKGKAEEKLLNGLMLRAMAKAVYAEHNVGHFGLAFMHYTHFTSPIRRYPDLMIHRMLDEYLHKMPPRREHHYYQILPDIADHTSAMERRATDAERDSAKIAGLFAMRSKVGEDFDGTITGVQQYGFFVGLENGTEGLVHVRELQGYYVYDESQIALLPQRNLNKMLPHQHRLKQGVHARAFRIGEPVRVKLLRVNFEKKGLDFTLAPQ